MSPPFQKVVEAGHKDSRIDKDEEYNPPPPLLRLVLQTLFRTTSLMDDPVYRICPSISNNFDIIFAFETRLLSIESENWLLSRVFLRTKVLVYFGGKRTIVVVRI